MKISEMIDRNNIIYQNLEKYSKIAHPINAQWLGIDSEKHNLLKQSIYVEKGKLIPFFNSYLSEVALLPLFKNFNFSLDKWGEKEYTVFCLGLVWGNDMAIYGTIIERFEPKCNNTRYWVDVYFKESKKSYDIDESQYAAVRAVKSKLKMFSEIY